MNHAFPQHSSRTLPILVALGALLALPCCKSEPSEEPAPATKAAATAPTKTRVEFSNEFTATADVTAVERDQRLVTLRREDGTLVVLHVGEAARNFDQIAAGDKVRVRYTVAVAASLQPAGTSTQATKAVVGASRSDLGDKPAGGVGMAMSARVKIESVDLSRDVVTFSLASGELISHRLATPEGREFAKGLKVGDVVQLDYAEGVALTVEEI